MTQTNATDQEKHQPKVFISYAFEEARFANQIVSDLTEAGIECWLDTEQIRGGQTFPPTLGEAIVNALAVIIIATHKSLQSSWVSKEINWAITHKKEIIPLLFENVRKEPGFFALNDCQWVSMLDGEDYTAALTKLVKSLQLIRAELNPAADPQREQEVAYLDRLNVVNLRELYTAMSSRSEQQFRHYGDRRMKVELLPVSADGSLLPKKQDFPDAAEAMLAVKRAALLGEPGGGKTTAIWKLAMEMAQTARQNPQSPIPLVVPLREWTLADQSLQDFIASQIGELKPYLNSLLQSRRAALLLDGLNELPVDQRHSKYDQVCRFIKERPTLMAIVSCRKEDYPPELGFDCINISPLDPLRIHRFAENYMRQVERPELAEPLFWKLAPPTAKETLAEFLETFGDKLPKAEQVFWLNAELPDGLHWGWKWEGKNDNSTWKRWVDQRDEPSGLMKLASNPFMLNMLIGNFVANEGELPKNRGELFQNFVQNRLDRELEGERILPEEIEPLREALAQLAFEMQRRPAKPGDDEYSGALTVLPKSEATAILGQNQERLFYLASSAGILNTDDPVRFTHQLLQEYFAARHLDTRFRAGNLKASEIWQPDRWWQRTNWEVAATLFTGLYSNNCTAAVEWIAEANPEIAAQCLDRSGVGHTLNPARRERLSKDWIKRLTDLKRDPNPLARAAVGRALGMTGWDNRKGVGVVELNGAKLPDIEWIKIPEGEFQYGKVKDEYAAKPQKLRLPDFWISRYPVTYAQFQTFLNDNPEGFNNPRWFEGLKVNEDDRRMNEQYYKFDNHPRDTVNWYQAMAFCRWLSWRLDQSDLISTATGKRRQTYELKDIANWTVRLPTEFEWEKAARGSDGRLYPYGNKFDAKKGNTGEDKSDIGLTNAVGIFPNGASPNGVEEMSGNVWEWCLTDYNKPQIEAQKENLQTDNARVLRGGSWVFNQLFARAVYRDYFHPAYRDDDVGFRVVCVRPPSS